MKDYSEVTDSIERLAYEIISKKAMVSIFTVIGKPLDSCRLVWYWILKESCIEGAFFALRNNHRLLRHHIWIIFEFKIYIYLSVLITVNNKWNRIKI